MNESLQTVTVILKTTYACFLFFSLEIVFLRCVRTFSLRSFPKEENQPCFFLAWRIGNYLLK